MPASIAGASREIANTLLVRSNGQIPQPATTTDKGSVKRHSRSHVLTNGAKKRILFSSCSVLIYLQKRTVVEPCLERQGTYKRSMLYGQKAQKQAVKPKRMVRPRIT